MKVVFVHGACVKDGDWWWHRTGAALRAQGIESLAPALPSCAETGSRAESCGLDDDVAAVRGALAGIEEPITIVAHSYGGIVTAAAAVGVPAVTNVVLISSYLPEPGESLASFGGPDPAPFLDFDLDAGTFTVRPELLVETFLHDCSPDIAAEAGRHLAHQNLAVVQHPVGAVAWSQVRTTYLVCTGDRGTPAARQREFAGRADRVVELDSGHHPFLSRPDVVAGIIGRLS